MITMYEYTDPDYYSKVNEFDDDPYHDPPNEEDEEDELLTRVRKFKRRYRDYGEYCDAMEDYYEYGWRIVEKYGGKRRLNILFQLGKVKDYLPPKPKIRHNKKNRPYLVDGMPREYGKKPEQFCIGCKMPILPPPKKDECINIDFHMKPMKGMPSLEWLEIPEDDVMDMVNDELDVIRSFYNTNSVPLHYRMSKREQRKAALRKMYKENAREEGLEAKYKRYLQDKYRGITYEDKLDAQRTFFYKGVSVTAEERDQLDTLDAFERMGIHVNKKKLDKSARRVVRKAKDNADPLYKKKKKKGKKGKKGKKKKKDKQPSYLKKFASGKYHSFKEFEDEMLTLTDDIFNGMKRGRG